MHTLLRFIATGLLLLSSFATAQSTRIAVLDLETVVQQSAMGKALLSQLEQAREQAQQDSQQRSQRLKDMRQRILEGQQSLSSEKLAELQRALERETVELRRWQEDKQREMDQQRDLGLQKIEAALAPVVAAYRKSQSIDLILKNQPGIVLGFSDAIDITAEIVQALDAR